MPCGGNDICCFNPFGPGDHCGMNGQCDPGYVELTCSSPADCPGQVCCATIDPTQNTFQGISCQSTCNGPNEVVVCGAKFMQGVCQPGQKCVQSQQLGFGYRLCM
jgi:hypothetical protein